MRGLVSVLGQVVWVMWDWVLPGDLDFKGVIDWKTGVKTFTEYFPSGNSIAFVLGELVWTLVLLLISS